MSEVRIGEARTGAIKSLFDLPDSRAGRTLYCFGVELPLRHGSIIACSLHSYLLSPYYHWDNGEITCQTEESSTQKRIAVANRCDPGSEGEEKHHRE